MADRVVLHIGTMKSGTTYLQEVCGSGFLESVGGFYPGGSYGAQTRAVVSLLRQRDQRRPRAWRELADGAARRDGTAFYSHEFLSFASREVASRVVGSFGPTPVEVVLTVRDQHRAIPAQWQTFVRNRGTDDWAGYVGRLRAAREGRRVRSRAVASFRRAQDVPAMLDRWTGHSTVSAVTVVVVPPAGSAPDVLWRRFCEAARLPPTEPPGAATRANESLGYASCDLLRRLNEPLQGLTRKEHGRAVKTPLATLLRLRDQEERPALARAGGELARELNRGILDALARPDVRLIGRPEELPVESPPNEPVSFRPPSAEHVRRALELVWVQSLPGMPGPAGDLDTLLADLGHRLAVRFGG